VWRGEGQAPTRRSWAWRGCGCRPVCAAGWVPTGGRVGDACGGGVSRAARPRPAQLSAARERRLGTTADLPHPVQDAVEPRSNMPAPPRLASPATPRARPKIPPTAPPAPHDTPRTRCARPVLPSRRTGPLDSMHPRASTSTTDASASPFARPPLHTHPLQKSSPRSTQSRPQSMPSSSKGGALPSACATRRRSSDAA
jgi:hypothetical protein